MVGDRHVVLLILLIFHIVFIYLTVPFYNLNINKKKVKEKYFLLQTNIEKICCSKLSFKDMLKEVLQREGK